jgi:3-hydroxybutyryl-CoA dehydrogenase
LDARAIHRVALVGAGLMGRRLAYSIVLAGKQARMFDVSRQALEQAPGVVWDWIREREADGRLPQDSLEKARPLLTIHPTLPETLNGVDLAIEVVSEKIDIKRKVFAEIDQHLNPEALIGTNTSSIPGSKLASATRRPDKCFNFNVSGVDSRKNEVMGNPQTAPETIASALRFFDDIGLITVLVKKEIMGYIGNRVWRAVKKEALHLIAGGFATPDDIDRAYILDFGTDIGPCAMMDQIGLKTIYDVEMIYFEASGDPSDKPPDFFRKMVEAGKLGVKNGEGFYTYPNPRFRQPGWLETTT